MVSKRVTAVLPYHGPVTWSSGDLDKQARAWLNEHRPASSPWRPRLVVHWNDTRRCAACPKAIWQACPYALWARSWEATQLHHGRAPGSASEPARASAPELDPVPALVSG